MKQTFLLVALALTGSLNAQTTHEVKYRRSSLHLVLIDSDKFPQKETVEKAYKNSPFPDKYNNHLLDERSLDPTKYTVTDAERAQPATKAGKMGKMAKGAVADASGGMIDKDATDMPIIIGKYIKESKLANKLVAKWFNRKADGTFDMNLVGERGSYNATEMEANIAKGSARGVSSLADAGEELIGNTFVVFSKLNFVPNEPVARVARDAAKIAAAAKIKVPALLDAANAAADLAYEKAKEGYSVWTTAYLYKLKWNDSVSAVFYNDLWASSPDAKKKTAFDTTSLFQMEYIGSQKAQSLVTFNLKIKRSEEEIINLATIRNVDNVFSKLQREYDVFKPKVPLFTGEPITAKIGLKEGLQPGDKFEVLEQEMDPKTGLTTYKKKGKITVMKDMIWDNRFNAGDPIDLETAAAAPADTKSDAKKDSKSDSKSGAAPDAPKPVLDRTTFKGGSKFYSGMLIRQIK